MRELFICEESFQYKLHTNLGNRVRDPRGATMARCPRESTGKAAACMLAIREVDSMGTSVWFFGNIVCKYTAVRKKISLGVDNTRLYDDYRSQQCRFVSSLSIPHCPRRSHRSAIPSLSRGGICTMWDFVVPCPVHP